jgi:signal transduction histidine kinase
METVGGWVLAGFAAAVAAVVWHGLSLRMEAVARACHELRGPLTAARLGLELGTRSSEISVDRLRAIDLELGRAALALDDLADAGAPKRRRRLGNADWEVAVDELVADSVDAWRPAAAASATDLTLRWSAGQATVRGDRLRLAQAIGNLIANAIEHGGETVEVLGTATGGSLLVEVLDDGGGLPPRVREVVVAGGGGRWRSIRRRGGRGLGLAIASDVAEAHGGRLRVESAPSGTRMVLELPLDQRSPAGRPRA